MRDPAAIPDSAIGRSEVKTTTCYMCACRCGIRVHLRDGEIRYIEGNPDHPLNKGVMCAKGASGIMKQYSPARLTMPLKRKDGAERGTSQFEPISWEEAFSTLADRLGHLRATDPKKFALFTGRDQMQALTGLFAKNFGTPNYAAHGGFCSVNMAAGMIYTIGGSFWEFGGPDLERAKLFIMIGTAEDHHSNLMKMELGKFKRSGGRFIAVNPVRTGYAAIAVIDGKHYPVAKTVIFTAALLFNQKARLNCRRPLLPLQLPAEKVPARPRRIANVESLLNRRREFPLTQIGTGGGSLRGVEQAPPIQGRGLFIDQIDKPAQLLFFLFFRRNGSFRKLNLAATGQLFYGPLKIQIVILHHKGENITGFTAAKTVIKLLP